MTSEGPGGIGTRTISNRYPATEGLTAGTTKRNEDWKLQPEKNLTKHSEREGLE